LLIDFQCSYVHRDKLQLKAVKDGSESYAALEKKAELYDKLLRGEVSDEEEKEKYSVDFLKKGYLEDEFEEMERERRGEPVDNLRKDPETANPAGVDVEKQRLGVGWRPGTTTGLTQEQKQIIRFLSRIFLCKTEIAQTCLTKSCVHTQNLECA
jgi:hypothetical protein